MWLPTPCNTRKFTDSKNVTSDPQHPTNQKKASNSQHLVLLGMSVTAMWNHLVELKKMKRRRRDGESGEENRP
ncbi:hypothetical protein JTE90_029646 [Oedothorax gibbosus]|uniref:Uncharacterized protein n=1 Tax=Oedothorax gibbosus TaxID=931172 RepID=A0AAV6VEZ3_9ARAC|nr:hypothetical protein JTE90_029646 [Oedothorax gibbosus]